VQYGIDDDEDYHHRFGVLSIAVVVVVVDVDSCWYHAAGKER
jgi:hypothetical protein